MDTSIGQKVYEIRDGSEVLGQFSVKSKALSFKRNCSSEGRRVKVVTRFVKDSEKMPEPNTVPKKTVKKIPKTVGGETSAGPKADPKPIAPKKTKKASRPTTKIIPTSNEAFVSGRTIKSLSKLFTPLDIYEIPLYSSSFFVVDPIHVAMIGISTPDGKSLFGLDGNGPVDACVNLQYLAGKCSISSTYKVYIDGEFLYLDDGTDKVIIDIITGVHFPKCPNLSMPSEYVVDPIAFDAELRRVKGILNGGRNNIGSNAIRLYGNDGDLIMTGRNEQGYGFSADVGDGDQGNGSAYTYSYLKVLSDMFLLSDSMCTLSMDDDYPLEGKCSMDGLQLTMLIAPRMEEQP